MRSLIAAFALLLLQAAPGYSRVVTLSDFDTASDGTLVLRSPVVIDGVTDKTISFAFTTPIIDGLYMFSFDVVESSFRSAYDGQAVVQVRRDYWFPRMVAGEAQDLLGGLRFFPDPNLRVNGALRGVKPDRAFSGTLESLTLRPELRSIQAYIPEPGTWAMMIAGFGLVGGAMRRRSATAVTETA